MMNPKDVNLKNIIPIVDLINRFYFLTGGLNVVHNGDCRYSVNNNIPVGDAGRQDTTHDNIGKKVI